MLITRNFVTSVVVAGAGAGAIAAASVAVVSTTVPTTGTSHIVLADPANGTGGSDGQGGGGGCGSGPGWNGCGGWKPLQGGTGGACPRGGWGGGATSNQPPGKIGRRQYADRHGSCYARTESRRLGWRFLGHHRRVHLRASWTDAAMGALRRDRQGHERQPPKQPLSRQRRRP